MTPRNQIIQLFVVSFIAMLSTTLFFNGLIGKRAYVFVIIVYLINCFALSTYDQIKPRKD